MTWFIFCVAVIAVYKTFDSIPSIFHSVGIFLSAFKPFFVAFVIAYMLNMPSVKLSELIGKINNGFVKKHAYGLSILIVYVLAAVILGLVLGSLLPAIYSNVLELTAQLPAYINRIMEWVNSLELLKRFGIGFGALESSGAMSSLTKLFDTAQLGKYLTGVFSMTSSLFSAFITLIASVYMLLDKKNILEGVKRLTRMLFKEETANSLMWHVSRVNDIFNKFIYCRLICSVICGTVSGIVLTLMNVQYALILALITGVLDMIPYFGSIISFFICVLIAFLTGGVWKLVWVAVAMLIIQQCDGNLLAPKIMGDSLELRPLWIVVAVSVGGTLFGFIGMLVSVPLVAVIKTLAMDYLEEFAKKREEHEREKARIRQKAQEEEQTAEEDAQ